MGKRCLKLYRSSLKDLLKRSNPAKRKSVAQVLVVRALSVLIKRETLPVPVSGRRTRLGKKAKKMKRRRPKPTKMTIL